MSARGDGPGAWTCKGPGGFPWPKPVRRDSRGSRACSTYQPSGPFGEDRQLAAWLLALGAQSSWYGDPQVPLTPPTRRKVAHARVNATRGGRPELHGKVVAELMLGFWWSLLSDEYNRRLRQPCLRYAFDGPLRRARLHSELDELRRLRNRLAHHEPIHGRDLVADHQRVLDVARRISPQLSARIESVSRVPGVLLEQAGRRVD